MPKKTEPEAEVETEATSELERTVADPPPPNVPRPPPEVKPEPVQFLQRVKEATPVAVAGFVRREVRRTPTEPNFVKSRFAHRAAIRQFKLARITLGRRSG